MEEGTLNNHNFAVILGTKTSAFSLWWKLTGGLWSQVLQQEVLAFTVQLTPHCIQQSLHKGLVCPREDITSMAKTATARREAP